MTLGLSAALDHTTSYSYIINQKRALKRKQALFCFGLLLSISLNFSMHVYRTDSGKQLFLLDVDCAGTLSVKPDMDNHGENSSRPNFGDSELFSSSPLLSLLEISSADKI